MIYVLCIIVGIILGLFLSKRYDKKHTVRGNIYCDHDTELCRIDFPYDKYNMLIGNKICTKIIINVSHDAKIPREKQVI